MLRAVLVGCGAMSKTNIEAALATRDVTFVGLVDIDPAHAERRAAEFALTGAEIGTDLSAILDRTRPDFVLDVVVPQRGSMWRRLRSPTAATCSAKSRWRTRWRRPRR